MNVTQADCFKGIGTDVVMQAWKLFFCRITIPFCRRKMTFHRSLLVLLKSHCYFQ